MRLLPGYWHARHRANKPYETDMINEVTHAILAYEIRTINMVMEKSQLVTPMNMETPQPFFIKKKLRT